jgi:type IV secretion system protein VirB4
LDGHHYDIGHAETLSFCPLADLSTDSKKVRAKQFIEELVVLQRVPLTPAIRDTVHLAIESLSHEIHANSRNLTVFCSEVQNEAVRSAVRYYTLEGQIKLLDATEDSMQAGHLQTFEMNWLLNQKPDIYLPVLLYIFDQIESRLEAGQGKHPTLIILEEAWLYIGHEVFARKLKDWLKTLRKKNARVIFATQSLADLYDPGTKSLTAITAAILESCPTKIYLPNPSMEGEIKTLYEKIGLSERQIDIINHVGMPKRHYYVVTPEGNRLIELGFNQVRPMALAFIGLSKEKSQQLIECKKTFDSDWVYHWLMAQQFPEWAAYWQTRYSEVA